MMRTLRYILDDAGDPIPCNDLMTWADWIEQAWRSDKMRVAADEVEGCRVSTVFLGLNHAFRDGPPILYETMVFVGDDDTDCRRYGACRQEALDGHARVVAAIRAEAGRARRTATVLLDAIMGAGPST